MSKNVRGNARRAGFTLLEALIGMAILAVVSTALYLAYSNTLDIVTAGQYHSAAANLIESEIEIIRNMDYEDVGTVGGVPAGILEAAKTVTLDRTAFQIVTFVRSIDDPFDGILGSTPNDTAPADYKLVEVQVLCPVCPRFGLIRSTTTIAPRNLESADGSGNLFIQVLDADGTTLPGATVSVLNTAVTPLVNLTDVTGSNGQLQLVGVPTSSAGYQVTVSKAGYSSERTYQPGAPGNPNPSKPHVTVAKEQLTISTFSIDLTSVLTVRAIDRLCAPVSGMDLLLTGSKLIGTSPDVPKYSAGQSTRTDGSVVISGLEWDSYALQPTDTAFEIAGTSSSSPLSVNPGAAVNVDWLVIPRDASALMVSVRDSQGKPVNDATVRLQGAGYDRTILSGRTLWDQSDWSSGQFSQKSIGMNTNTAGMLTLAPAGGPYATDSYQWLESETVDLGTSSASLFTLSFSPASQPPATGADSMRVQIAANNNGTSWNYAGPDGTANTFFTATDAPLPSLLSGNRYLRYRVELRSPDETATPNLEDIAIGYRTGCLPGGSAHLNGLNAGTYSLTITKPGFQPYSDASVPVNGDWQEYQAVLQP